MKAATGAATIINEKRPLPRGKGAERSSDDKSSSTAIIVRRRQMPSTEGWCLLVKKLGRHIAAVVGKLLQKRLVKKDIHLGGIAGIAGVTQFLRQFLAL